ncbi:hypothetical protein DEH80_16585 [Abyssibacter profundi]|uniref:Polysaccharide pyruvyl transferase domain-containing protein n=2 Tax=Abyssibacter profundi TaxID=2182787 RepID=A0A383XPM3_9GAMM|nr:hypothetical protein DEH80_16585 [Abyssibacter profundi]
MSRRGGGVKVYVFSLRTQFENAGDLLINAAAVAWLSRHSRVYCLGRGVPQYYADAFISAVTTYGNVSNIRILNERLITTIALWPVRYGIGKAVYVQKPGHYTGAYSFRSFVLYFVHAILMLWIKLWGAEIYRMPSSMQPAVGIFGLLTAFHSRLCDKLFVRDGRSLEILEAWGCRADLAPDLAHFYFSTSGKQTRLRAKRDPVMVTIVPRAKNVDAYWSQLIERIQTKTNQDARIKIVSQVFFDSELCDQLADSCGLDHFRLSEEKFSIEKLFDVYKSVNYVISDRLHALLAGRLSGACPVMPKLASEKVLGYFDTWFRRENECELDECGIGAVYLITDRRMVELKGVLELALSRAIKTCE